MSDLILEFPTAAHGLEAELSLLESAAAHGSKKMMIWRATSPSLTLPERFCRTAEFDDASKTSAKRGWPVMPRRTGGGITPQGPGVLNVALAFAVPPKEAKSVPASYAAICDPLADAFLQFGIVAKTGAVIGSFCDGDYNLEIEGRKIVGTAQRWRGASVLCHALVLIDLELASAVSAAQRLSDDLGLGDTYSLDVHTTLAQFIGNETDRAKEFAEATRGTLLERGYSNAVLL